MLLEDFDQFLHGEEDHMRIVEVPEKEQAFNLTSTQFFKSSGLALISSFTLMLT